MQILSQKQQLDKDDTVFYPKTYHNVFKFIINLLS